MARRVLLRLGMSLDLSAVFVPVVPIGETIFRGTLVDLAGNPVLGTSGPIKFDSADTDITINRDGTVSTSQGTKGKLAVVEFTDPQVLAREGDNYYSGPAGNPGQPQSAP